jgi:hypothetical protein
MKNRRNISVAGTSLNTFLFAEGHDDFAKSEGNLERAVFNAIYIIND